MNEFQLRRKVQLRATRAGIISLVILVFADIASAQDVPGKWAVGIAGGIASFSMGDMKEYQSERNRASRYDTRIVKSFPVYFSGSFHVSYFDSRKFFDLAVGRTSTGGRISYSDYSGEYVMDHTVVMGYTSAGAGFRVGSYRNINIYAAANALLYSNLMKEKEQETYYDVGGSKNVREYIALSIGLAPGLELHRRIGRHLLIRQQTYFEIHIPSELISTETEMELTRHNSDPVTAQPTGIRARLGLSYIF